MPRELDPKGDYFDERDALDEESGVAIEATAVGTETSAEAPVSPLAGRLNEGGRVNKFAAAMDARVSRMNAGGDADLKEAMQLMAQGQALLAKALGVPLSTPTLLPRSGRAQDLHPDMEEFFAVLSGMRISAKRARDPRRVQMNHQIHPHYKKMLDRFQDVLGAKTKSAALEQVFDIAAMALRAASFGDVCVDGSEED